MATSIQSNPVYYSLSSTSSGEKPSSRTVVLHKKSDHQGFGVFIGEDVPSGLYVITVERDSPAADANIQAGDRVLAVNGRSVSSMSSDPKEEVIKAASTSDTLTLTLQSTDLLKKLDMPLGNSFKDNRTYSQQQNTPNRATVSNPNLENYIKSLFRTENVHIIPSAKNANEFIVTSDPHTISPMNTKSSPNFSISQSRLNDYKPEHRPSQSSSYKPEHRPSQSSNYKPESHHFQSNDHKKEHQHHHRHRPHHREPKPKLVETKETQTSNNEDEDDEEEESIRTPPITTAQAVPRAPSPKPKPKESRDTKRQSQHMSEVVVAAVAAARSREQPINHKQTTPEESDSDTSEVTPPPTPPTQTHSSRNPGIAPVPLTETPSQEQTLPPPYVAADTYSAAQQNNQDSANGGAYNVRDAQENREAEPAEPQPKFATSTARPEGIRTVNLHRSPNFEGFGFHLQYNKQYYLVQRIEEGSPAEESGLHANDVVCSLNQQPTDNMPHAKFVQIVTANSDITLVVQYIDEYLRAHPQQPRNQQIATAVSAALREEGDKHKSGPLKALNKITHR